MQLGGEIERRDHPAQDAANALALADIGHGQSLFK
jgi:hypothetical protein